MKKKILVWILAAAMIFKTGGSLVYAQNPQAGSDIIQKELTKTDEQTDSSANRPGETSKESEESADALDGETSALPDGSDEMQDNTKQTDDAAESDNIELPEDIADDASESDKEEMSDDALNDVTEPETSNHMTDDITDDTTEPKKTEQSDDLTESEESKLPVRPEEVPGQTVLPTDTPATINSHGCDTNYFDEYEMYLQDYELGDSESNYYLEEPNYYLFQIKEEKKVQFNVSFELSEYYYPEDGDPVFTLHKVTKEYDDEDDTDDYDNYEDDEDDYDNYEDDEDDYDDYDSYYICTQCILNQQGSFSDTGSYSFSAVKVLKPSWYIIEINSSTEETDFDYSFNTKDITTYATSLTIPSACYLNAGEKKSLPVSNILPQGAVSGITWKSDNNAVAKVSSSGTITGVSYGTCNITAVLKNKTLYTCKLYVESPELSSKKLNLLKEKSAVLKVKKAYQKAAWKSSNPSIAAVDAASGKVTGKKAGKTTITASVSGKTLKCTVTVENPKLNLKSKQLIAGDTFQLKMQGTTQKVSWKSSSKAKATVSSKGLVTAKKPGKVKITATVSGTGFSCVFTIKDTKLKHTSIKMTAGTTRTLEWKRKVKNVKWSSENKKIAAVNRKGLITAKKAGVTKIIAKSGSVRYVCIVTCEKPRLSKTSFSIQRKKSYTLKVTNTTMKVSWKSSDKSIATVSSKGKVAGKKAGKATITAKVGGKELKCKVTVKALTPSYSVKMPVYVNYDTTIALMQISNTGKGTMRIFSKDAKFLDSYFSSLNRNMRMINYAEAMNNNIVYQDYIDIAPGHSAYVLFLLDGYSTYYDTKTTYQYTFSYDGVNYQGNSSYYYGYYYKKL